MTNTATTTATRALYREMDEMRSAMKLCRDAHLFAAVEVLAQELRQLEDIAIDEIRAGR